MAFFLAPSADVRPQFFDSQGNVLAGGWMYWYAATTTTLQDTFTTSAGSVANTNPIELDGAGRPKNGVGIYLTEGLGYKLVLKDSALTTIFTQDNVVGITTALTNNEWQSSGLTATYISATQFSVPGDQTTDMHKRRRLKVIDSGGTKYGTITAAAYSTLTTVTVEIDAGGSLASPLTSVSWSIIRADNPSIDADMVHRKSSDAVASAATTDIWSIQGDFVHVTGSTGPITSFGTAPYAGARRTVIFDSTPTLTHSASLDCPGAANIVSQAGDMAEVRADTTTNAVIINFIRAASMTATLSGTETLTNKTLTSPTITTGTLTNPSIDTVTGAVVATQANMESASATNLVVSPGRQQFHPSAAKAWADWTPIAGTGSATINASYNVTSISDDGTGLFTVTIATDFSSAHYAISHSQLTPGQTYVTFSTSQAAGTLSINVGTLATGTAVDPTQAFFTAFGDHA